jgi:spore germination cell wall hydrolase CwlJ-like protein
MPATPGRLLLAVLILLSFSTPARNSIAPESGQDSSERHCLAEAIYFEARGEPRAGWWTVGRVILNRTKLIDYPNTICGVVYQHADLVNRCQFSFVCDEKPNRISDTRLWSEILFEASGLLNCGDGCDAPANPKVPLALSTHYHATWVSPSWSKKLRRTGQVGNHIFYRS